MFCWNWNWNWLKACNAKSKGGRAKNSLTRKTREALANRNIKETRTIIVKSSQMIKQKIRRSGLWISQRGINLSRYLLLFKIHGY